MNSLAITCEDAKTTFLLARCAERLARPLLEQAGDAWRLSITATLGDKQYPNPWHISIQAYYGRANGEGTYTITPARIRRLIQSKADEVETVARALEPPRNRVRSPESFRQRNPELWDKHFEAGRAEYQAKNEKEKD